MTRTAAPAETPRLLTVSEACEQLRISRWTLYRLIREQRLQTVKIGERRLIPRAALEALIHDLRSEDT